MHSDTTPEAARVRLEALRAMSGAARLEQALELSDAVKALAEAGRKDREKRRPAESEAGEER